MKRNTITILLITVHLIFIFLQIHKHAFFIQESFRKQKNEKNKAILEQKKQTLMHELYKLRNHRTIKKFARNKLNMNSISLTQIKTLKNDD